jgi:pimeloyl-ACP methyl ester carboxylesterase
MKIVVDGLLTTYEKSGTGPVVLLLHGWGDDHNTFQSLQEALSRKFTVVAVDLPGFGGTEAPKETFNLYKYAAFVHSFMTKIGVSEVYGLIGHSNGGAISIRAIADAAIEPKKLVLLASSGIRSTYNGRKKAMRLAAKAAKLPTKLMPVNLQNKLKKKVYSAVGSDLFVAEHLQPTFKAIVGEDLLAPARKITTDTLLIYGSEDKATLPAYGELFTKSIKNSKLHVIEGAEHFLHHTHAKKVEDIIMEFLV